MFKQLQGGSDSDQWYSWELKIKHDLKPNEKQQPAIQQLWARPPLREDGMNPEEDFISELVQTLFGPQTGNMRVVRSFSVFRLILVALAAAEAVRTFCLILTDCFLRYFIFICFVTFSGTDDQQKRQFRWDDLLHCSSSGLVLRINISSGRWVVSEWREICPCSVHWSTHVLPLSRWLHWRTMWNTSDARLQTKPDQL